MNRINKKKIMCSMFDLSIDILGLLEISKIYCEHCGLGNLIVVILCMLDKQNKILDMFDDIL